MADRRAGDLEEARLVLALDATGTIDNDNSRIVCYRDWTEVEARYSVV